MEWHDPRSSTNVATAQTPSMVERLRLHDRRGASPDGGGLVYSRALVGFEGGSALSPALAARVLAPGREGRRVLNNSDLYRVYLDTGRDGRQPTRPARGVSATTSLTLAAPGFWPRCSSPLTAHRGFRRPQRVFRLSNDFCASAQRPAGARSKRDIAPPTPSQARPSRAGCGRTGLRRPSAE